MKFSSRELVLSWVTCVVVLIGISYWLGKPKLETWRELARNQEAVNRRLEISQRLLDQRGQWDQRLNDLRIKLSKYPFDKDVTADYLKILERVANESKLSLLKRKPKTEKHHGDLYELAIDCTWEGDLDALAHFLYALEQENVTMDVEQLTVTLKAGGKGKLKGNFTLMCVYTRIPEESSPEGQDSEIRGQKDRSLLKAEK